MVPALELVFVYGTLKRGHANHHWLEGAQPLGDAEVEGLTLHDLGPFPMAVEGMGCVRGELYAVDRDGLERLDALEGCPRLYTRVRRTLPDGRQAWLYVGRPGQVRHAPQLADGVWRGRNPGGPACRPARRDDAAAAD